MGLLCSSSGRDVRAVHMTPRRATAPHGQPRDAGPRRVVVLSCAFWQSMQGANQIEPGSHVDVHERGSTEAPDERLLTYLRERLQRPAAAYLRPPVRIAGGFDTRIYALQLAHMPPAFSRRLIVRIFRDPNCGQRAAAEGALQNALADAGYLVPRVIDVCTDATVLGLSLIHI